MFWRGAGENWSAVSEHVGKHTHQCVAHFLTLPITDSYEEALELGSRAANPLPGVDVVAPAFVAPSATEPAMPPTALPFADTGNPLLAQVAFLAAMVGPRVAAAAAQAALHALVEDGLGLETEVEAALVGEKRRREAEGDAASAPPNEPPTTLQMQTAAAAALAAAAVKAKLLADQEEREIQRLVNQVMEAQLARLDAKVKQFDQLEVLLEREREQVERHRATLFTDRVALQV